MLLTPSRAPARQRGPKWSSPLMPRQVSKASPKAANFTEVKLPSEYKHTSSSCLRRSSACMQHNPTKSTPHPFWGKSKRRIATNQLLKESGAPQGNTQGNSQDQGIDTDLRAPCACCKNLFCDAFFVQLLNSKIMTKYDLI